jgi:hypothetical protein
MDDEMSSIHTSPETYRHQDSFRSEPLHVVVAGDDPEFIDALVELLEEPSRGARVSVCAGPGEALHLYRRDPADVMIVDGGCDVTGVKGMILGLPTWNVSVIALVDDPVELWEIPPDAPRFTALSRGLEAREVLELLHQEVCWEVPVN